MSPTTREDTDRIVSMLRSGNSPAAVASALGLDVGKVYKTAQRAGLTSWSWKAAFESEVAAEYAGGAHSTEVAARHGCTPAKVLAAVRRTGGHVRPRGLHLVATSPSSDAAKEALRLVAEGHCFAAAARAVGLSRERVRQIVAKYGGGAAAT